MELEYRMATNDDVEAIIQLQREIKKEEPDILEEFSEETFRSNWNSYPIESNPYCDVILCLHEGNVIGRIDVMYERSYLDFSVVGYIDWIYVSSSYRGKGIGKTLLSKAEEQCRKHDCFKYYLFVANNERAATFYQTTDLEIKTINTAQKIFGN